MVVSKYAFVTLLTAMCLSLSISAQELRQESCSNGQVWIPDDGIDVEITEFCPSVKIAGNSNTIVAAEIGELTLMGNANHVTALQVGELMAMGDDNIVYYRAVNEPKKILSGNGNRLIALGESNTSKDTDQKSSIAELATSKASQSGNSAKSDSSVIHSASVGSTAPLLVSVPGPRVRITGKLLKDLPDGFRMHVYATNYWTSRDLTRTRQTHIRLTHEGQFEKSSFAIFGSMLGDTGTIAS